MNNLRANDHPSHRLAWTVSVLLVVIASLALRFGTHITKYDQSFDEQYSLQPIHGITQHGWTVQNAIDFQETKGPGFIWPYAAFGDLFGDSVNTLRWLTILCFCITCGPLFSLAKWVGVRGWSLVWVALLYVLLPHLWIIGQLVMSEPSFVLGSFVLMWLYIWSTGELNERTHRVAGPIIFGIVLSVLLHNRVHAVALAGAIVVIAFLRNPKTCWPWILASFFAGLSRIPLWLRWGGLVSSENQDRIGVGLRLESLTYLAAGLVPFIGVFLWPALISKSTRNSRRWVLFGGIVGLALGTFAQPKSLEWKYEEAFNGLVSAVVLKLAHSHAAQAGIVTLMAIIGVASIGALCSQAKFLEKRPQPVHVLTQMLTLSIVFGWGMYALSYGYVFDRYIMPWCILLPILSYRMIPRWLLIPQMLGFAVVQSQLIHNWLMLYGRQQ